MIYICCTHIKVAVLVVDISGKTNVDTHKTKYI